PDDVRDMTEDPIEVDVIGSDQPLGEGMQAQIDIRRRGGAVVEIDRGGDHLGAGAAASSVPTRASRPSLAARAVAAASAASAVSPVLSAGYQTERTMSEWIVASPRAETMRSVMPQA